MLDQVSKVIETLSYAQSLTELRDALSLALSDLGMTDFLVAVNKRRPEDTIWNPTLTNWPDYQRAAYVAAGLTGRDPHLQRLFAGERGFLWRVTDWQSPENRHFSEFVKNLGLAGGISVPLPTKPGRYGAMILGTQNDAALTTTALQTTTILAHMATARALVLLNQSNGLAEEDLRRIDQLSDLQMQVLGWVAKGKTNREIAMILDRSRRAIDYHLEQIFAKLGVATRTQAALFYLASES